MSSQARKFTAGNWAVPSHPQHGTWKGCACIGSLQTVGKGSSCPGQRAADLILLAAQVISVDIQRQSVPVLARSLSVVEWSHLPWHADIHPPQLRAEQQSGACSSSRLVSALCHVCVGDDDSFGSSVDGPVCSSHDSLLPYI